MKKSLIAFVTLQAVAALAHAGSRRPSEVGPIVLKPEALGEQTKEIKLNLASENDDALCLKSGTHRRPGNFATLSRHGDKRPIHNRDLNPVSIAGRNDERMRRTSA